MPINSRKSLSLSTPIDPGQSSWFNSRFQTSSLHQSNGSLFFKLLVLRWTRLENMSRILSVSPTTRIPSLCTGCAILYSALEGANLYFIKYRVVELCNCCSSALTRRKESVRSTHVCIPNGPLLLFYRIHFEGASSHGFAPSIFSSSLVQRLWHALSLLLTRSEPDSHALGGELLMLWLTGNLFRRGPHPLSS